MAVKKKAARKKAPSTKKTVAKKEHRTTLAHLIRVLEVATEIGGNGEEFTTMQIVKGSGLSHTLCYKWLLQMREHGVVEGYLSTERTGRGDYRWTLRKVLFELPSKKRKEKSIGRSAR